MLKKNIPMSPSQQQRDGNDDALVGALSGAFGGFVSATTLFPFDMVKTRMQGGGGGGGGNDSSTRENGNEKSNNSAWNVARAAMRDEDTGALRPARLMAGAHIRGIQSAFEKFLYFYIYEALKKRMRVKGVAATLLLGYVSDVLTNVVTFPADTVINGSIKEGVSWDVVLKRLLASSSPLKQLYSGYSAKLLGGVKPAIQFLLFDKARSWRLSATKARQLTLAEAFVIGASCRAVADCIAYPSRVLKVRRQGGCSATGRKINTDLVSIVKNEGVSALYAGLSVEVARGTLSAGMMLTVKEKIAVLVKLAVFRMRVGTSAALK